MAAIPSLRSDFHRIPLPVAWTDSAHGEMASFELITARVVDGGIHDPIERDLAPVPCLRLRRGPPPAAP